MGFGSEKTIDEMIEEQETMDEEIKLAQRRKLLRQAKEKGVDPELYRKGGAGTGMDWDALKLRI